jgi:hypothetical protein
VREGRARKRHGKEGTAIEEGEEGKKRARKREREREREREGKEKENQLKAFKFSATYMYLL